MSTDPNRKVRAGDIVGVARVCEILKRNQATVWQWRANPAMGFPPPIGRIGNRDIFDVTDVYQWIDDHPELRR